MLDLQKQFVTVNDNEGDRTSPPVTTQSPLLPVLGFRVGFLGLWADAGELECGAKVAPVPPSCAVDGGFRSLDQFTFFHGWVFVFRRLVAGVLSLRIP